MTISMKIRLGFLMTLLFTLILAGISYFAVDGIKDQIDELQKATNRLSLSLKIENEFTGAISEARGFVAYGNEKMIDNFSSKLKNAMEMEKQILAITDDNNRAVVEKLISDTAEYTIGTANEFVPSVREQMREKKAGNLDRAQALQNKSVEIGKKYVPFAEGIMKGSHSLVEENTQIVQSRLAAIQRLVEKVVFTSILFSIISIIVVSFMTIAIPRSITKPLQAMVAFSKELAGGEFQDKPRHVVSKDEIGQLADALADMRNNLRILIKKVSESAEQVAASSEELTASADQSTQAANQVALSITDVAADATEQLNAANDTSAVVQQMSAGIQKIASNTNEVAGQSNQAAAKANEGGKTVDKAVGQMKTIEETSLGISEAITKLNDKSKEIGQIVEAISGIAGQTNLLALNAAIEAARAGEQGRGFAVVAEEVRKLAEDSQGAAKQIAVLISEIQTDTGSAVQAMGIGAREVQRGTEMVADAGAAFKEIEDLVTDVSTQVKSISDAVQQMAIGSQQIVESVKKMDDLSQKSAGEAQSVSAATEEQLASMEEIAVSSQALARMAEELQSAVAKFKV